MSAAFEMPATVTLCGLDIIESQRAAADSLYKGVPTVEYIRLDIAQAQLDKMCVARGLQHDAKWHELYAAIKSSEADRQYNDEADFDRDVQNRLETAVRAIDNGVYIEPDKWSVL